MYSLWECDSLLIPGDVSDMRQQSHKCSVWKPCLNARHGGGACLSFQHWGGQSSCACSEIQSGLACTVRPCLEEGHGQPSKMALKSCSWPSMGHTPPRTQGVGVGELL